MLSWEWKCSWSSADRRCFNYIWVINDFIAYYCASYIRDFTVFVYWCDLSHCDDLHYFCTTNKCHGITIMKHAFVVHFHIDGLVLERRNSSALAMELCLSCIKPINIWMTVLIKTRETPVLLCFYGTCNLWGMKWFQTQWSLIWNNFNLIQHMCRPTISRRSGFLILYSNVK